MLAADDIVVRRGRPFTSGPRTFLDLAAGLSLEELVVLGDAVLRRTDTTPEELAARVAAFHGRGAVLARQAVPLMAERVDSPQETRMRLIAHAAGFTGLVPNVVVLDGDGGWLGQGDLVDLKRRVVVQYDGGTHFWAGDRVRTLRRRQQDAARDENMRRADYEVAVVVGDDIDPAPFWDLDAHAPLIAKLHWVHDRADRLWLP